MTRFTPIILRQPMAVRRLVLLLTMLVSGGLPVFPREPLLLVIIVLCLMINGWCLPSRQRVWPALVLLAAVLVVTLIRPGPVSLGSLVSRYANYLAALLLLNVYLRAPVGALAGDLCSLLHPMAWQALATVLLSHAAGMLFVPMSVGEQHYMTLLGLLNYHTIVDGLTLINRPDGFFFEPGVFQIYLNLYLYLALFVFHRPHQVALAVLAVLSTQSTTGMIICLILLGAALAQHLARGTRRRKVAVVMLALTLAPPMLYLGYDNITEKLFGASQGSSWAREYDLYTGLNIVAENPWLGIGFEVERYLAASGRLGFEDTLLTSSQLEERPTSNGIVQLLYSLGIPLGVVFAWGLARQRVFRHRVLIGLWMSMSLFGEALLFSPFFLMIVFSGFLVLPSSGRPRVWPSRLKLPQSTATGVSE
ncbi:MAG: hypothetical protein RLY71_961 [Pseudomonadota bacterium]|jgi:hypothetical protein